MLQKCVVTFTANLSVTIKHLTRYKQKVVLAAILEGKSMPSNMAANTNHTTLLKNQSAIKYLPYMHFLSNFGCKLIFKCSVNFWRQQDSNSLFKGSIGHVTSECKWPIGQFQKISIPNHGRLPCFNPPLPLEIPKCATPACPQNSIVVNPPSPSEFPVFFLSTFST